MAKRDELNLDSDFKEEKLTDFVRRKIASEEKIYDLAELFKVFGDSTRTKILCCLEVKDLYVGELAEVLNMSVSAVSHQLRILRQTKIVKSRRSGKEVFYSLDDEHISDIYALAIEHLKEE